MAKIIHTADLHIGASFSFLPEEKSIEAKKKQWQALKDMVQVANNKQIDAILIAGDLFDDPFASGQIIRKTFSILGKCLCPVFISPGNHDYYHGESPYHSSFVSPNIHVFSSRVLSGVPLSDGKTMVYGAAFEDDSAYVSIKTQLLDHKINLCCIHGDLISTDSGYNPIKPEEIADSGFDYMAFGHNHQFSGLKKDGNTYYACSGSFCALTVKEYGRRGYLLGEVDEGKVQFSFIKTKTICLNQLDLDVSNILSDENLQEKITVNMPEDRENTYFCLNLMGTKYYDISIKALKRALDRAFFYCILQDNTKKPTNIWEGIRENDLRGAVLRRMHEDLSMAQGKEKEKILRAAQYLQSAMME